MEEQNIAVIVAGLGNEEAAAIFAASDNLLMSVCVWVKKTIDKERDGGEH